MFTFVDIDRIRYSHDKTPDTCPICHVAVQPDEKDWALVPANGVPKAILEIVFKCPRRDCGHHFIARYKRGEPKFDGILQPAPIGNSGLSIFPNMGTGLGEFKLFETTPSTLRQPLIAKEIVEISPLFPEIYSQSMAAEALGLNQIAGMGYRKSLEFLIKDFCISTHPAEADKIRSSNLAPCIRTYVDSPQVKICADRAAWLGNDEAHYERRWADLDIKNLTELIMLTMLWIQSSILTQKYSVEMLKP